MFVELHTRLCHAELMRRCTPLPVTASTLQITFRSFIISASSGGGRVLFSPPAVRPSVCLSVCLLALSSIIQKLHVGIHIIWRMDDLNVDGRIKIDDDLCTLDTNLVRLRPLITELTPLNCVHQALIDTRLSSESN